MPAHIQLREKKELDDTEIGVVRAGLVRELLSKKKRKRLKDTEVDKKGQDSTGRMN